MNMGKRIAGVIKATCLATVFFGITSTAMGASRYTIEAECSGGNKEALVVKWPGYGTAMYIYENGRLQTSGYVTKSVSGAGTSVKIVSYALGSVLRGGANLRIRVRDTTIPQNTGSGHLTFDGQNKLVDCTL